MPKRKTKPKEPAELSPNRQAAMLKRLKATDDCDRLVSELLPFKGNARNFRKEALTALILEHFPMNYAEVERLPAEKLLPLLIRIRDKQHPPRETKTTTPDVPPLETAADKRNKWLYEQCCKGTPYVEIRLKLKKKPASWERLDTDQGVKDAARRYAEKNNLPLPASRKSGRPTKRKSKH